MLNVFVKMMDLLNRRERFQFGIVVLVVVLGGISDMVGVATILPFLSVVTDPSSIHDNRVLSYLYALTGAKDEMQFIFFMGLGIFVVIMLGLIIKTGSLYASARFGHMRKYHISNRLMAAYLRQPYTWFLTRHSAELTKSVLLDVDHMIGTALLPAMQILMQIVSIILMIVLLFVVEPVVASIAVLVMGGIYVLIFLLSRKTLWRMGQIVIECDSARYRTMNEALGGIKEVKLAGLERTYLRQFQSPSRRHAESLIKKQMISEMPRHVLEGVTFGGMVLLILSLLYSSDGSLTEILPVLGLFTLAGLRLLPAIQRVYAALAIVRSGNAVLELVYNQISELNKTGVLELEQETDVILPLKQQMSFKDVTYNYPSAERKVVNGLSFDIAANSSVGIVGGTGAGKTTTVDLVLGLLNPIAGEVVVDGVTLDRENMRSWQNNLGYVPQQIFLVDDTITANITYGIMPEKVDVARVEKVARLAELHDFVLSELPEGYDTNVGERGVRLSGGQRQRIGIARALYHDPDVLIMDEATSALDNITERSVMKAVSNLGGAKTVIMIAHRLTTVRNCDNILFLEQGKVTDSGTYDELVKKNAKFREMTMEVE